MNEELYEQSKAENKKIFDNEDRVELMVKDLQRQQETRSEFRRRRIFNPEEKGTYISEDNRKFNEKLYRYFGTHVQDLSSKDSKPTF